MSLAPSVAGAGPSPRALLPRGLAAAGALAFVAGLFLAPKAVWPCYLLAVFALASAGLAGGVFLALHHVAGGRWGRPVLRVAAAMLSVLPFAGALVLALAFGASALYAWADPATVAADPVLSLRAGWMSVPWVLARAVLSFAAWTALGGVLARRSRRAAEAQDEASRAAAARAAAWFLVAFAPTYAVFTFDWILSLDAHFASTMFAVYHFAGLLLSGLALVTALSIVARRRGLLAAGPAWDGVLHDLGKLLFAFAFFWGYIWFCQHMLIWYTNLPEETAYYARRHAGGWQPVAFANVLLNWTIPFVVLLPARLKRSETTLLRVAGLVLLGRFVDLFLSIAPPSLGASPALGVLDVLLALGAVGAFLWCWSRSFARLAVPSVPTVAPGR